LCACQTGKNQPPHPSPFELAPGRAVRLGASCRPWKPIFPQSRASIRTAVVIFSLISVAVFSGFAQNPPPTEYQIKAAFLYNFAKFVRWPSQTLAQPDSPIVIGVLGDNVFGDDLEHTIHDKTFNNHPFQFKEFHSVTDATNCQILFISTSEQERLPKILNGLRGTGVLTVSEMDHFIEAGGMIKFVIEENRVRFQINNEAAVKEGLTISPKLLSLAITNH
jgi:hypothetical protein